MCIDMSVITATLTYHDATLANLDLRVPLRREIVRDSKMCYARIVAPASEELQSAIEAGCDAFIKAFDKTIMDKKGQ